MLQKPKILVVDNDATFLRQMKTLLREMGTAPRCLSSSPDAVEAINREKFDGVFLTWNDAASPQPPATPPHPE